MESLISVFRMTELSAETRIKVITALGRTLNIQFGGNITEPLVDELVAALTTKEG